MNQQLRTTKSAQHLIGNQMGAHGLPHHVNIHHINEGGLAPPTQLPALNIYGRRDSNPQINYYITNNTVSPQNPQRVNPDLYRQYTNQQSALLPPSIPPVVHASSTPQAQHAKRIMIDRSGSGYLPQISSGHQLYGSIQHTHTIQPTLQAANYGQYYQLQKQGNDQSRALYMSVQQQPAMGGYVQVAGNPPRMAKAATVHNSLSPLQHVRRASRLHQQQFQEEDLYAEKCKNI